MEEGRSLEEIVSGSPPSNAPSPPGPGQSPTGSGSRGNGGNFISRYADNIWRDLRQTVLDALEKRKRTAADRLGILGSGLRQVSEDLETRNRAAGRLAGAAAGKMENLSATVRDRRVDDLAKSAGEYARSHPGVIFAGGIAAGFILATVARSSSASRRGSTSIS
jgi:hypothetical protein